MILAFFLATAGAGPLATSTTAITSKVADAGSVDSATTFVQQADGSWEVHFAAFFDAPVRAASVKVHVYDVTDRKTLVASFDKPLEGDGSRLISYVKLDREKFGVNRRILMVVERDGSILSESSPLELGAEATSIKEKLSSPTR